MAPSLRLAWTGVVLAALAGGADAQTLGTFKWQLQPFCNVVTATITVQGGVFAFDGTDDQCGGPKRAAADGTAFLNPDGTVGFGFTLVPAAVGAETTVSATIDTATLSGTWRDSTGNAGDFRFTPGAGTGGSPRPTGTRFAGAVVGLGLRYDPSNASAPVLGIDTAGLRFLLDVRAFNENLGLGDRVFSAASAAFFNTAFGRSALRSLATGNSNTAIGHQAATGTRDGSENVAVGLDALLANVSGNKNVAVGALALDGIRISNGNTALGRSALFTLDLGNDNIAVGHNAGAGLVAGSRNIYIGADGVNLDNFTTRLGTSAQQRTFIGGIRGLQTGAANAVTVMIDANGQLGTINSSRRFKDDIQDLGAVVDDVLRLRPVRFRYTTPFADGSRPVQYGLIAEEVADVLPALVSRGASGDIETVQYHVLPTLLLAQVQRLERERAALTDRLDALQRQVELLVAAAATPK